MTDSSLLPWGFDDIAAFGARPHRARHRLHEQPVFTDDALADLLDRLPRSIVHPYTMGDDPARPDDWRRGAETDLPGKELLEVVARGHLWLNLVGIHRHDAEIARLVDELYAGIRELVPGFVPIRTSATLLLSSPSAMVYYHADNQPNLLWHLRGRSRRRRSRRCGSVGAPACSSRAGSAACVPASPSTPTSPRGSAPSAEQARSH